MLSRWLLLVGLPTAMLSVSWLFARGLLVVVTVENQSMAPTLEPGDRVLVLRRIARRPNRGDIVIVWPWNFPPAGPKPFGVTDPFIKRVTGMPGQTIATSITEIHTTLQARERAAHDSDGRRTWYIPVDHYFVRGDQPIGGFDSLSWGPVPLSAILGVVIAKLPYRTGARSDWSLSSTGVPSEKARGCP